jgi:hypothetical protein
MLNIAELILGSSEKDPKVIAEYVIRSYRGKLPKLLTIIENFEKIKN